MRQILLYQGEDGYWVVECPSLPGCITQGKTKEEAITNAREAIERLHRRLERGQTARARGDFNALLLAV